MATVDVSDIELVRVPFEAPAPVVHVSDISFVRVPPAPPAPRVQVAEVWLTKGFEPPVVPEGGIRRREGGTWAEYGVDIRLSGVWQ